jgi:ribonuclease Z
VPPSGFGLAPQLIATPADGGEVVVIDDGTVRIVAFGVDHSPVEPAFGYRIEAAGRRIVISGDTKACDCVASAAQGADLLVHETLAPAMTRVMGASAAAHDQPRLAQIFTDIEDYHTSPADAGRAAAQAGVRALALTHIVPPLRSRLFDAHFLREARSTFGGDVFLARDGLLISIAPDGAITHTNLLR